MQLFLEFDRDRALVPVPNSVTVLRDLPAQRLKQSRFGTVEAHGLVPTPGFRVDYAPGKDLNGPPERMDLALDEHAPLFASLVGEPQLATDLDRIRFARSWFDEGFRYTISQTASDGDALTRFLTDTRAGHCEYYATATVLMLRHLGVPARYAVGFALEETLLGMTVVGRRHAHAWAIAWVDGAWTVVDTTPGIWLEAEAARASPLRPVADLLDHVLFKYRLWWDSQTVEDYEPWLVGLGVLLAIVLAVRLFRSESVVIESDADDVRGFVEQGLDSPFYRVIDALTEAGFIRADGEPLSRWVQRIEHAELLPLVDEHYRLRFDPGCTQSDLTHLSTAVERWIADNVPQPA